MLALLLALPLELAADRLEVRGDAWWAEGAVSVRAGDLVLHTESARGLPDPACPDGRVRLLGPVAAEGPQGTAHAGEVELCLPTGAVATALRIEAPRLRLAADRAAWSEGTLTAEGVEGTACACPRPPWRLTARRAEVVPGEGAWAEWPVVWVGPVPVATAPRWYVPLARRQTGFLLPIVGFDGEDGLHGRLPFFLTLGQSADVTLAPGYRGEQGLTAHGTLRWAATEHESGHLEVRSVPTDGVALAGAGSLPWGPARLALEGTASTDESVRQALWPGLADRRRDHLRGAVSASVAGRRTGLGLSAARHEDLTRPPGTDARVQTVAPDLWLRWYAAAGPAELTLAGRALTLLDEGDPRTLADVDIELEIPWWIGPLQLRPVAGLATTVHLDDGQGQTGAVWTGAEARAAVARSFEAVRHEVALVLDGRWAEARPPARGAFLAIDLPLSSGAAGATLENRLAGPDLTAFLAVRAGYEAEAPVEGWERPLVRAGLEADAFQLDAGTAGAEAMWLQTRAESEGLRAHAGLTRLRPSARTPTLRRLGPQRPLAVSTLTGDLTSAQAGLGFTLGPLSLDYTAALDADAGRWLGQEGGLAWASACDCWSARLGASHVAGRDLPDLWLSLQVP